MDQKHLDDSLKGIRQLLSHLHGEVTALEDSYSQVLQVLRKLEGVVEIDDLSGLLRRKSFFAKWETLLDECKRASENSGILLIDIDHFKAINDTHGHPTGDEVIKRVANLVKQFESPRCFAGRYGGEEFAVAIRGTEAEMLGMAEMIRRGVERLHGPVVGDDGKASGKVSWKCTISVGLACSKNHANDTAQIVKAADDALYVAKRNGRNQVRSAA